MGSRVLNLPPLPDLRGKAEIAGVLSAIEQHPQSATPLLDEAFESPKGVAIGITGPPGAGKSTLINALIAEWRKAGLSVAVIAVEAGKTLLLDKNAVVALAQQKQLTIYGYKL